MPTYGDNPLFHDGPMTVMGRVPKFLSGSRKFLPPKGSFRRMDCMKFLQFGDTCFVRYAAEHGGNAINGGGHPSDSKVSIQEAIEDAFGRAVFGHAKTAGNGDMGVPGSRSNPVRPEHQRRLNGPVYQPADEEIALMAYHLWEDEGRPDGKADEHWRRAREILKEEGEYALA
jgi:hypothetical protein